MAATKLTLHTAARRRVDPRGRLCEFRRAWVAVYAATWILTLLSAAPFAINLAGVDGPARGLLELSLSSVRNPPPSIGHVLGLLAHNLPITAWPLLLGVMGAHRYPQARRVTDIAVAGWLTVNVLPVGAALGAYGFALLSYLSQLPFEWAALALGTTAWVAQRHETLSTREGLALLALITSVLLFAAILETVAVPHR